MQVFWASLSLLFSSYVHIYQQALILLSTCLQQLALNDSTTQNVLVSSAPVADLKELQRLLAGRQTSGHSDTTTRTGRATPVAERTEGSRAPSDAARGHYGATRIRSPDVGSRGTSTLGGNAAAARPPAAAVSSSIQSFVGGSDPDGARPMHWAVGQLLPWPERGPDGPAHNMIAVQQVLFKGLLFQDTQLPTVQLLTLLANGLCQLAPSASTPVQGPLDTARSSRDHRVQDISNVTGQRASTPADGLPISRPLTAAASRSNSRGPATGGLLPLDETTAEVPGVHRRTTSGIPSLQQEQRLGKPSSQQQRQQASSDDADPIVSSTTHARGVSMGGALVSDSAQADVASVSRSAPELQALLTSSHAVDTQPCPDSSGQPLEAAERSISSKRPAEGSAALLTSSWGAWHTLVRGGAACASTGTSVNLPGTKAAFQSLLGHRHAQLLVTIASVVPFFCSQLGQLEPESELLESLQVRLSGMLPAT